MMLTAAIGSSASVKYRNSSGRKGRRPWGRTLKGLRLTIREIQAQDVIMTRAARHKFSVSPKARHSLMDRARDKARATRTVEKRLPPPRPNETTVFTNRPGYAGAAARCYLKDKVKPPRHKPCCISGVVRQPAS